MPPHPSNDVPDDPEELEAYALNLLASLSQLSGDEAHEAVLAVISAAMHHMDDATIRTLRAEIVQSFPGTDLDIVQETLDTIDGALALREIRAAGE